MIDGPKRAEVRAQLLLRRSVLLAEVDTALSALVALRGMRRDRTDDDEHDPDGAPLSVEWSRLDGLHRAAMRRLVTVDAAIANLDAGHYGICARCGRPISAGRLEVMPDASRCVDCADRR